MKTNKTNNNATINNSNLIKEESIMTTTTMETIINAMANATNNEEKLQIIYLLLDYVNNITNKHDVAYINKGELVDFANYLGMNTNRKTTRTNAYDFIKNYAEELKVDDSIVSVGDMSEDRYVEDIKSTPKFVIDRKHGDYIVKNIVKASFVASKGDNKGKRIVTMHKLFGIIRKAYTNNLNDKLEEMFIKDVINQLVKLNYIGFKKYESGAIVFYPTVKAANYVRR